MTDADGPSFGAPFHYDIIDGNQENKFRVSKDGLLSTAAKFDRQVKDNYQLTVRVFDNADSPLFSDATVSIKVVEESGYPPHVVPLNISIYNFGNQFVGGIIGRLKAVSRYPFDFLTYAIVSDNQNLFSVNQLDGTIIAADGIDAGSYIVNISVTNGRQTAFAEAAVSIIELDYSMVDSTVILRLGGIVPEEFVRDLKARFQQVLAKELGISVDGLIIVGVQPSGEVTRSTSSQSRPRGRRSTGSDLDIVIAAKRADGNFVKRSTLKRKVQQASSTLEAELGIHVAKVFTDACEPGTCKEGECETSIDWHTENPSLVVTESESFMSTSFSLVVLCRCNPGYGGKN